MTKSQQQLDSGRYGWWRCDSCKTVNKAGKKKCKKCGRMMPVSYSVSRLG